VDLALATIATSRQQQSWLHRILSAVGFSQGLSASQQCFSLTTNQHQPGLSARQTTSEQAVYLLCQHFPTVN